MINNIPPKQTLGGTPIAPPESPAGYDSLPPADPVSGGLPQHGLVLHDPSLHGDANAFPVLKAFQDYLEMERQQARKRLVTLTIFTFMGEWNDFMWPLIVLSDDAKYTLPVALASLSGEHVQDTGLMMAGSVLTVLPVVVLFIVLQRAYIRGGMMGSVKG